MFISKKRNKELVESPRCTVTNCCNWGNEYRKNRIHVLMIWQLCLASFLTLQYMRCMDMMIWNVHFSEYIFCTTWWWGKNPGVYICDIFDWVQWHSLVKGIHWSGLGVEFRRQNVHVWHTTPVFAYKLECWRCVRGYSIACYVLFLWNLRTARCQCVKNATGCAGCWSSMWIHRQTPPAGDS